MVYFYLEGEVATVSGLDVSRRVHTHSIHKVQHNQQQLQVVQTSFIKKIGIISNCMLYHSAVFLVGVYVHM